MTNPTSVVELAQSVSFTDAKTGILIVGGGLLLVAASIYALRVIKGMIGR